MAEEKKKETKAEEVVEEKKTEQPKKTKKVDKTEAFIERKLKILNALPDGAKKQRAVERLLRNRRNK